MKRIVVLGSNGQLGKTLKSLTEKDSNRFVFYSKQELNITDKKALDQIFVDQNFDFCINCAAYTNVEVAEKNEEEAFLINAEGVKNIAEVCKSNNIKLIHISTDYVFDGKKKTPYKTNDKTNPINIYGKSKLKGERYIKETLKEHYIIRTSWLYSIYEKNFLTTIIKHITEDNSLKITTNEKGTPTSCIDLAHFIFHIVDKDNIPYGIYNFTANGSATWYKFANEIAKIIWPERLKNISPTDNYKTEAKRPNYSVLDIIDTEKVYKKLNNWQLSLIEVIKKLKDSV